MTFIILNKEYRPGTKYYKYKSVFSMIEKGNLPEELSEKERFISYVKKKYGIGTYKVTVPPSKERRGFKTMLKFRCEQYRFYILADNWEKMTK